MKQLKNTMLLLTILLLSSLTIIGQSINSKEIDALVERTLKTFDVPGIAVAVVKDGKVIHAKGYGISSLNTKKKVDENTLFGIASNSKAFTAAAMGILVDEGKVGWNDKVIDYIPEFRLYNSYVTEEFTIKDLMTHRSGLGLGAGDLMLWPDSNTFTTKDIIHNLRYLKPVSAFRTKYDYDNLLYLVAGEIIARVSGKTWDEFVETRIMKPLQMDKSAACYGRLKDFSNVIDSHVPMGGKIQVVGRDLIEYGNAAAGIYSNISDMSKWVIMQINQGKYGDSLKQKIFSVEVSDEMWTPQTILPVRNKGSYNTNFQSYGLGWFLNDVKGFKQASHTGALTGIYTQVTIIQDLNLGIIVLTNQQSGGAMYSITNQIKDSYLGVKGIDRIKENSDRMKNFSTDAEKIVTDVWGKVAENKKSPTSLDLNQFVGTYRDNWFGDVTIKLDNEKLLFHSKRSPSISGEMFYYKGNTFVVKWFDRSFDADAFVMFGLDFEGKPSTIKMNAFSPLTDFSYDFQDLDFVKVE